MSEESISDFVEESAKFGLKEGEFDSLSNDHKKKLIILMARIMEKAYRRGVQQALYMQENGNIKQWILDDPHSFRYESLEYSVGLDGKATNSLVRLQVEENLEDIGLKWHEKESDTSDNLEDKK